MFSFNFPNCGATLKVGAALADGHYTCPQCKDRFSAKQASAAPCGRGHDLRLPPSPPSPLPRIEILINVESLQAGERGVEFPCAAGLRLPPSPPSPLPRIEILINV